MDSLRVDLSRIEQLDVVRLKKNASSPPLQQFGSVQRPVVESAIDVASRMSDTVRMMKEIKDLAATGGRVAVSIVGGRGPMIRPPASTSPLTVGLGAGSAVFAGVGLSMAAGIYGSTNRHFGFYSSKGVGFWTDAGTSGEIQVSYIFGPPSKLGGMSWSIGVGADAGAGIGVSCSLLLGTTGPPFEIIGFTLGIGAAFSALPISVAVQASSTQLIPVI